MAYVYLLFTRSNSIMSKTIYHLTSDEYTHVSISVDPKLNDFYSFARRYSYTPLPAGFTKESVFKGFYSRFDCVPCRLCAVEVDKDTYHKIRLFLQEFYENKERYKYDVLGTILCKLGKVYPRDNYRFCSQFVSEVLVYGEVIEIERELGLIRPMELAAFVEEHTVFEGNIQQLRKWIVRHTYNNYNYHSSQSVKKLI